FSCRSTAPTSWPSRRRICTSSSVNDGWGWTSVSPASKKTPRYVMAHRGYAVPGSGSSSTMAGATPPPAPEGVPQRVHVSLEIGQASGVLDDDVGDRLALVVGRLGP